MTKIAKALEIYKNENGLEIEEVDTEDKSIDDIKVNLIEFSDYYLKFFNNFYKEFKDCANKEVIGFIEKNKCHFNILLSLYNSYNNHDVEYGRMELKENIISYIEANYFEMSEFLDVCMEVFQ